MASNLVSAKLAAAGCSSMGGVAILLSKLTGKGAQEHSLLVTMMSSPHYATHMQIASLGWGEAHVFSEPSSGSSSAAGR